MTVSDELKTLLQTKKNIRKAITEKGVNVPDGTPFANYAERISKIGTEENINPYEFFYKQRTSNGTNMQGLFAYANSPELDLSILDTSQVTNMFNMFSSCTVPYLDLSGFDVSNVINMSGMFYLCSSELNIKGWDTKKLINASQMFSGFSNGGKYLDLSVLDFSNVTQADNMFESCNIDNIDIRNINLNLAKLSALPFRSVSGTVLDLSNYDITGLKSTNNLGYFCSCKTIDLTNWKTTEVTNMRQTFSYCSNLEKIIMPDWDMTNTTNTSSFFNSCGDKLNYIDLSRSNDTTIAKMVTLVPTKTLDAYGQMIIPADSSQANIEALAAKYWKPIGPRIDVTSCTVIPELDEIKPGKSIKLFVGTRVPWYGNEKAIEFISSDETIATIEGNVITSTGVEGTIEITARNTDTQEIISSPIIFPVTKTDNYPNIIKFRGTSTPSYTNAIKVNEVKISLSTMDFNPFTGIYTYESTTPITSVVFLENKVYSDTCTELIKLNTSSITSMGDMFYNCSKITSLDLSDWDTTNVTNMTNMFRGCSSLTALNVSNFNTTNVTTMNSMFSNCKSLTELDLSSWDMSNVIDITQMFYDCPSLTHLQAPQNISTRTGTLDVSDSPLLTHESLMSIINNLAVVSKKQSFKLGPTNFAKLTDEEIAIGTQKGWDIYA